MQQATLHQKFSYLLEIQTVVLLLSKLILSPILTSEMLSLSGFNWIAILPRLDLFLQLKSAILFALCECPATMPYQKFHSN